MGLTTTLIPARAGSVRIPHKNIRLVAGKPLVAHAIEAGIGRILVDTDDPQVASIAQAYGVEVVDRPPELAGPEVSIDDLLRARYLPSNQVLLLLQPTVIHPKLARKVAEFAVMFNHHRGASWTMGTPAPHLYWDSRDRPPVERTNSQNLAPRYQEIGCRLYAPGVTDPAPQHVWPVTEIFDIDTHYDLAAARVAMERREIIFRVAVDAKIGSGHLYRCLALATQLDHHRVYFTFKNKPPAWALDLVAAWPVIELDELPNTDLEGVVIVNDTLDTTETELAAFKAMGVKIASFEDLGPGARFADLLINDLYPASNKHPNEKSGPQWAVMRPEFSVGRNESRPPGKRLLVTFGGTDPAHITERALQELAHLTTVLEIRVVNPPGRPVEPQYCGVTYLNNPPMAAEMAAADLVLTSGGRSVWEAMAVGTPVVTILQNPREQTHYHLRLSQGMINLGPARLLESGQIRLMVEQLLLSDREHLSEMRQAIVGLVDARGAERVALEIERLFL